MKPRSSMSIVPRKSFVLGSWPIAMKTPSVDARVVAPVFRFFSVTASTPPSFVPWISSIVLSRANPGFGFAMARSRMIFDARSVSRRWMTMTFARVAREKVRLFHGGGAAADDQRRLFLKKKLSQVAHADMP